MDEATFAKEFGDAPFFKTHKHGFGAMEHLENTTIDDFYLLPVPHLREWLPEKDQKVNNERSIDREDEDNVERETSYNKLMADDDFIVGDIRRNGRTRRISRAYVRAGPRKSLYFNPTEVKAAIVTCGGLCPGLNNVVRDITKTLWELYGVRDIYGIRMGFSGFYNWNSFNDKLAPVKLSPRVVADIHHQGGTFLGSNRGGFDIDKILGFCNQYGVNQVYVIGGDGTHRAANKLSNAAKDRGLMISVAGVPKTIDNDVDLLDRSFGFNTSVEEAQRAIRAAKTEAKCLPNGIGIVKLMGRSAGFIAAHATLSSGDVDLCLIPEVPIVMDGPKSCLAHIERVIAKRGHAVVVVAEGAGEELLGQSTIVDAGGNKKLPPIGEFMKAKLVEHFKSKGIEASAKYIDPSYMIRSVPANAADSLYCMLLAQNAVHGSMAGYTGFTVGLSGNRTILLPITAITQNSPRSMDPYGRTWERILCMTRQPNSVPPKTDDKDKTATSTPPPAPASKQ